MSAQPPERAFVTFPRGEVREEILTSFRWGLRKLTNPDTGLSFTETEIAAATARLSRFYIEADAIDLVLLSAQARDLFFADQMRPDRAASSFLTSYHGGLWGISKLSASGGSGPVDAEAAVGTVFLGSTTVPDPAAHWGTAPDGKRYQVLYTTTTGSTGVEELQLKGIDTGVETNLAVGVEITWQSGPAGASGKPEVTTKFTGGFSAETDSEFARRVLDTIRRKEGAGNNAQMRAWTRQSTTAVEDAFVYACALNANSVRIAITQKRGDERGPTGRQPSVGTLSDATVYMTPPGSPVVPAPPLVVLTGWDAAPADTALGLSMPYGQSNGWTDDVPWPTAGTSANYYSSVTTVTDQTHLKITRGTGSDDLPSGVTAPAMMLWDESTSSWETLDVQSVVLDAGNVFDVVLNAAPSFTVALGDWVSPDAARRDLMAETIELYFDSLGPGELVDLSSDPRAHRAFRYIRANEQYPQRAGTSVITWLQDALGAALSDGSLLSISQSEPAIPTQSPLGNPEMIVAGQLGIYPL